MSFRFRVTKVWPDPPRRVCHVIGIVEEGTVLPPALAAIVGRPGETVHIDSMALGGVLPDRQVTCIASSISIDPQQLEGCILRDA